jgi:hypothetical protein
MERDSMSQNIRDEIKRLVVAFPQRPIMAETQAVYVDALSDMDPAALRMAVDVVIRSDDWFPTIKRLRTACEDLQLAQFSAAEDGKWIKRWISGAKNGYDPATGISNKPSQFPNPVMAEAVRLFGWTRIHQTEEHYFDRDWEKVWNDAKGLVLKRTAAGEVGDALTAGTQPENVRQIKAVS